MAARGLLATQAVDWSFFSSSRSLVLGLPPFQAAWRCPGDTVRLRAWNGGSGPPDLAPLALLMPSGRTSTAPWPQLVQKHRKERGPPCAPTHRHPAPHAVPRGDVLVALDTFVAPVTLDRRVPFHPRVLHHLQEGREGCQGRLQSHIPEPGA